MPDVRPLNVSVHGKEVIGALRVLKESVLHPLSFSPYRAFIRISYVVLSSKLSKVYVKVDTLSP